MTNSLKTVLLLGLLSGVLLAVGELLGGAQGLVVAFAFAVVMNFVSYWFSDKIVLKMYRAQEVGPDHKLRQVRRRRRRGTHCRRPVRTCGRIAKARNRLEAASARRQPGDGSHVHRQSVLRRRADDDVQHASPHRGTHSGVDEPPISSPPKEIPL